MLGSMVIALFLRIELLLSTGSLYLMQIFCSVSFLLPLIQRRMQNWRSLPFRSNFVIIFQLREIDVELALIPVMFCGGADGAEKKHISILKIALRTKELLALLLCFSEGKIFSMDLYKQTSVT